MENLMFVLLSQTMNFVESFAKDLAANSVSWLINSLYEV